MSGFEILGRRRISRLFVEVVGFWVFFRICGFGFFKVELRRMCNFNEFFG